MPKVQITSFLTILKYVLWGALLSPLSAFAGPPYVTDDPDPTEYQHYEIFLASEYTRSEEGKTGTVPHLEVNYGLAPDVQIAISIPRSFSREPEAGHHSGLGDIEFGVKYRFIQETKTMPMVSFYPSYKSHTGSAKRGLGSDANEYFLPIWISKSFGDWTTYSGGGYTITQEAGAKNSWFFGWLLEKQVTERLSLGAEIFHNTEESSDENASTGFNVGASYDFTDHHHVVFSMGKGLENAHQKNQFSSYVAYLLTF